MKKNGLMGELIGEVFGCFILILLGDGVVANVGLAPRLAAGLTPVNAGKLALARAVKAAGLQKAHERVLPTTFTLDRAQPGVLVPA